MGIDYSKIDTPSCCTILPLVYHPYHVTMSASLSSG